MDKNDQTKEALQKLCKALKTQVDLKSEEGDLKLKEETQKRIDATTSFQAVITDLSALVEKHNTHNKNLQDENRALADKLKELLQTHEKREDKIEQLRTEFGLQMQLFEAQIAKAKLEKSEVIADFNKERLDLQKKIMESEQEVRMDIYCNKIYTSFIFVLCKDHNLSRIPLFTDDAYVKQRRIAERAGGDISAAIY